VVFTLPHPVAEIAFQNKRVVYAILFRAAAEALCEIAADLHHPGAAYYEDRYKQRVLNNLQRRAKSLDLCWNQARLTSPEQMFLRKLRGTGTRRDPGGACWPADRSLVPR
jgi:hypothetical protein